MNQGFLGYFSTSQEQVVAGKLITGYFQGFPFLLYLFRMWVSEPTIQNKLGCRLRENV